MGVYPAYLEQWRSLAGGRRVTIRPIRRQDEGSERAFFGRLSDETKWLRFMEFGALNERLIYSFTHVDYDERMAFVCEHDGQVVGEARYAAIPRTRSCDFGIVIADDWHKTGIAGLLMDALIHHARAHGFETMESLVLRDNHTMLRFVTALGFEVRPVPGELTTVQVVKALSQISVTASAAATHHSTTASSECAEARITQKLVLLPTAPKMKASANARAVT